MFQTLCYALSGTCSRRLTLSEPGFTLLKHWGTATMSETASDEAVACEGEHKGISHPEVPTAVLERAAGIFRAAGDPGRLRILHCLLQQEHCVSDLAVELSEGMSTISQRLKTLRAERLVVRRRDGKHIYYRLADAHVAGLVRSALEHASHDEP